MPARIKKCQALNFWIDLWRWAQCFFRRGWPMIEIENLTKSCGLSAFRYWAFPPRRFDDVPEWQTAPEAGHAPDPVAPAPPPATHAPGPPRVEGTLATARPAPASVLGEVAAAVAPAAGEANPRPASARPVQGSVLGDVAAALNTANSAPNHAPAPTRPTRAGRVARSAWRAATSPAPASRPPG